MLVQVKLAEAAIIPGHRLVTKHIVGTVEVERTRQIGYGPVTYYCGNGVTLKYEQIDYCLMTLDQMIAIETDPIKKIAFQALNGDPMAVDLMKDVLKC